MLFKSLVYISIFIASSSCFTEPASKVTPYALIYSGTDTCEGCPEAIANIARKANLPVKYVSDPKQIPALLNHAAIFAIGGTEDNIEQMRSAFSKRTITSIKKYFKNKVRGKWDKKWRLIVFDIPEEMHKERVNFRKKIKLLGFEMIQKSVFIFPYPCEEEIADIAGRLGVSDYIDILIAQSAGFKEEELLKTFGL